jgi:aspartyl-tRNA(Asn)/glutamyl-tRNA(Gln) amidotransferase subunit B
MTQAIEYETRWHIETLEDGGKIQQATVLFNPDTGETKSMRSKEEANDYRYFPDPDLLPLEVTEADKARVQASMPELPEVMKARFEAEYGLSGYDANALTASREMADYFVKVLDILVAQPTMNAATRLPLAGEGLKLFAKLLANWILGSLSAKLNTEELSFTNSPVSAAQLAQLLKRIADNTISNNAAKQVFEDLWIKNSIGTSDVTLPQIQAQGSAIQSEVDAIIEKLGLKQESDSGAVEAIIDAVLAANLAMVEEFKAGKEKAFNALVGQTMKASKGKANPAQVNEILKKKLAV